ncbi:CoA transferase [Rhodococcus sp. H36-A4]|uniref:CoA transferase n=1 Tax=Rhodococcus sp. H36-A4 TaxID=3004353 RepID=UPI0022AEE0C7|nr:CoA transferase [Rhodococcus sp. H36-A4]MCZ4079776.1 CoA transferase [Rhodococcus sp. H36-A4]
MTVADGSDAHTDLVREYEKSVGVSGDGSEFSTAPWGNQLSAVLPVRGLASGAVAAFASSVDRYRRSVGLETTAWKLSPDRISASFSGDRMYRENGEPVRAFAELSGFFECADGWVRTHANYPHHRRALLRAIGLDEAATVDAARTRIGSLDSDIIERRCARAGAIAVRVRTEQEWAEHEVGAAVASEPLVRSILRSDAAPRSDPVATQQHPLRGIRVLDSTRVIAGPVASRALALLGASVLRIDPPDLPEIGWQHMENGQGKRSALLDMKTAEGLNTARQLCAEADVFLSGYRPGAIENVGFLPSSFRPGIVCGFVSAWGHSARQNSAWLQRGFDSIVQAASGIAVIEGSEDDPRALPAQALDHASGYLLAAGIVDALTSTRTSGSGRDVSVSLARTASWLTSARGRTEHPDAASLPGPDFTVTHGSTTTALPALADYRDYPFPAHPLGSHAPSFDDDRGLTSA